MLTCIANPGKCLALANHRQNHAPPQEPRLPVAHHEEPSVHISAAVFSTTSLVSLFELVVLESMVKFNAKQVIQRSEVETQIKIQNVGRATARSQRACMAHSPSPSQHAIKTTRATVVLSDAAEFSVSFYKKENNDKKLKREWIDVMVSWNKYRHFGIKIPGCPFHLFLIFKGAKDSCWRQ